MIRILNVYYPARLLLLLLCETILIAGSFLLATAYLRGPDTYIALFYEFGLLKIAAITLLALLLSYYFDLYEPNRISQTWESYFRLLLVLSTLSFTLAGVIIIFPQADLGHNVLFVSVVTLAMVLGLWRRVGKWIEGLPVFRERVYVLGGGQHARTVVEILRARRDAGMEVVGEQSACETSELSDRYTADLHALCTPRPSIDRVIVAMENRRGVMPIRELLDLRLKGVVIENANLVLERLLGRLPLDGLNPSALIFTDGFRIKASRQVLRRLVSVAVAFLALVACLPLILFVALAVRFSSRGPIVFSQQRVGLRGQLFKVFKFRTMRQDAEAGGAVWAIRNDPRVTPLGRFLRKTRLDEIPQLWNVLRGDMGFVGPRPERPEFVQWLSREIPYYDLRHMIRPGITGWAQVRYQYGASLEETKRKLEYDLYYLKHLSLGLDLLILFETVKTIVLRRGAQ